MKLWDLAGQKQAQWDGHLGPVYSVAFSPDGQFLLSGDNLGRAQLWDWRQGRQFARWSAHPRQIVRQVTFTPDGLSLISGAVKFWPLKSLEQGCAWLQDYLTETRRRGKAETTCPSNSKF